MKLSEINALGVGAEVYVDRGSGWERPNATGWRSPGFIGKIVEIPGGRKTVIERVSPHDGETRRGAVLNLHIRADGERGREILADYNERRAAYLALRTNVEETAAQLRQTLGEPNGVDGYVTNGYAEIRMSFEDVKKLMAMAGIA